MGDMLQQRPAGAVKPLETLATTMAASTGGFMALMASKVIVEDCVLHLNSKTSVTELPADPLCVYQQVDLLSGYVACTLLAMRQSDCCRQLETAAAQQKIKSNGLGEHTTPSLQKQPGCFQLSLSSGVWPK